MNTCETKLKSKASSIIAGISLPKNKSFVYLEKGKKVIFSKEELSVVLIKGEKVLIDCGSFFPEMDTEKAILRQVILALNRLDLMKSKFGVQYS